MRGTIRLLKVSYGFIEGADGLDYFFHKSGLQQTTLPFDELETRMLVEFTAIDNPPKGVRAIMVRVT